MTETKTMPTVDEVAAQFGTIKMADPGNLPAIRERRKASAKRAELISYLKVHLTSRADDDNYTGPMSHGDKIIRKLVSLAEQGDMRAIDIILDRIEGKVIQPVIDNSEPKTIRVVWDTGDGQGKTGVEIQMSGTGNQQQMLEDGHDGSS